MGDVIRTLRERSRAKVGWALHDYVVAELRRDLDRVSSALLAELAELRQQVVAAHAQMTAWERRQRRDLLTVTDQIAARSSAEFQLREMPWAKPWFSKWDTLRAALKAAPPDGLYLEFGVATGSTLRVITELAPAGSVFGFDSFKGLPED